MVVAVLSRLPISIKTFVWCGVVGDENYMYITMKTKDMYVHLFIQWEG
jgi:hypothetical protein